MRVMVVAASKHGSTTQVAEAIAAELCAQAMDADVWSPADVWSLAGADAVVLGSAVYMGDWLAPAKAFVKEHRDTLQQLPVWLFSVGPIGRPARPAFPPPYAENTATSLHAVESRTFAGRLDTTELNIIERVVAAVMRAPAGDYRDWDEIREWARSISATLKAREPSRDPAWLEAKATGDSHGRHIDR